MIFDTNVVSEPLQAEPNEKVMRWLDQQDLMSCFITAINAAELLAGVERLPIGKKRQQLRSTVEHIIENKFAGRVLWDGYRCHDRIYCTYTRHAGRIPRHPSLQSCGRQSHQSVDGRIIWQRLSWAIYPFCFRIIHVEGY
jgi:hypothetical protein